MYKTCGHCIVATHYICIHNCGVSSGHEGGEGDTREDR